MPEMMRNLVPDEGCLVAKSPCWNDLKALCEKNTGGVPVWDTSYTAPCATRD